MSSRLHFAFECSSLCLTVSDILQGKRLYSMSTSSTVSSLTATARPVTHAMAHTPTLQLPPSPFLLFNTIQPLGRPQTAAKAITESIPDQHPGPLSLWQTDQPLCCSKCQNVPTHSGSFSHVDMPNTPTSPARTVSQPSCPPAPKRQPPLRLYGGFSSSDSQNHVSNDVLPSRGNIQDPHRHVAAAAGDTAMSLHHLVANAEAVSTLQDMLGRLRQHTPKVAHNEVADSAGSRPAVAMPVLDSMQMSDSPSACQDALQAKRIKLFGDASRSFFQTHCFRSSSAEAPPVQPQRCPLTVQSDPPTVRTGLPTVSDTDHMGLVTCQTSGLPEDAVALRTPTDSGVQLEPVFVCAPSCCIVHVASNCLSNCLLATRLLYMNSLTYAPWPTLTTVYY